MEYPESRLEFSLCFAPLVESLLDCGDGEYIKIENLVDNLIDVLNDFEDPLVRMGRSVIRSNLRGAFISVLLENGVVECR